MRHPLLVKETGLEVYVKHENHDPTGAFKIRGSLNLIDGPNFRIVRSPRNPSLLDETLISR